MILGVTFSVTVDSWQLAFVHKSLTVKGQGDQIISNSVLLFVCMLFPVSIKLVIIVLSFVVNDGHLKVSA